MMAKSSENQSQKHALRRDDDGRFRTVGGTLFDDGQAVVEFGEPQHFAGEPGPAWRGARFHARRLPSGLSVAFRADIGQIVQRVKHNSDPIAGDSLEWVTNKKKPDGKWQKDGSLVKIRCGSVEIVVRWSLVEDIPEYYDLLIDGPENVSWIKQPTLSAEEIDAGAYRPDNVVNSHALYIPQSGVVVDAGGDVLENWQTGKFAHVYCPQLVAQNGDRIWLDSSAPLGSPPRLRIFLTGTNRDGIDIAGWISDHASGWIELDPTFGYTSIGATEDSSGTAFCRSNVGTSYRHTGVTGDTVTLITKYAKNTGGGANHDLGIYSVVSNAPNTRLNSTGAITFGSEWGWYSSSSLSWSLTNGTVYCVCAGTQATFGYLKYDTGSSNENNYQATFPLPATWSSGGTISRIISMYATYTEAASTASSTPSSTPSATASSTVSSTPSSTQSPSATSSSTPSSTASATPSSTQSASATPSSTESATPSATESATASATPSATESATPSSTQSASATPSSTVSATPSSTQSASATPSGTESATPSSTQSASATPSATESATESQTPSSTQSPSATASGTPSATPSSTASATPSSTISATVSFSPSATPSISATPSSTESSTQSASATPSHSPSPGWTLYSMESTAALRTDDADAATLYTEQQVLDVATSNDVLVGVDAPVGNYAVHVFHNYLTWADNARLTVECRSSVAPSASTVYLQVYNHTSGLWETCTSNNAAAENTDFTMTFDILDLSDYKDPEGTITCRVYQLIA